MPIDGAVVVEGHGAGGAGHGRLPGLTTLTVAVKVTAWPDTDGLADEPTAVLVLALLTVWVKVPETEGEVVVALVIGCDRVAADGQRRGARVRNAVRHGAVPRLAPVVVSTNSTVPVGVPSARVGGPDGGGERHRLTVDRGADELARAVKLRHGADSGVPLTSSVLPMSDTGLEVVSSTSWPPLLTLKCCRRGWRRCRGRRCRR